MSENEPGQEQYPRPGSAGMPGWGPPPQEDPYAQPGTGWGAAPGGPWAAPSGSGWSPYAPPRPPRRDRPAWLVPVAALVGIAVVAFGAAFLVGRSGRDRDRGALPAPLATTARPTPSPAKTKPAAKPSAKPAAPVKTYSAPPDGIPVRGRIVDVDGRPVPNARIRLERHEGILEGLGRALTAVFSLGFACIGTDVCTVPYGQGVTNASGEYTVFLKTDVDDYDLRIEAGAALVESRIDFAGKPLKLPQVVVWSPTPRLEVSGGRARVVFAAPPARVGSVERYNAVVTERSGGTELVVIRDVRSRETFDARRIEDAPVRLRLSGLVHTALGKTWYTGHDDAQGALRPPSRGKGCVEYGPSGRVARNTAACRRVTDGRFDKQWEPAYVECKPKTSCDRWVGVDLGGVRSVRYVSVFGCDSFGEIQASVDGKRWKTIVDDTDEGCAHEVSARARYVRAGGSFAEQVTEVSVWY